MSKIIVCIRLEHRESKSFCMRDDSSSSFKIAKNREKIWMEAAMTSISSLTCPKEPKKPETYNIQRCNFQCITGSLCLTDDPEPSLFSLCLTQRAELINLNLK